MKFQPGDRVIFRTTGERGVVKEVLAPTPYYRITKNWLRVKFEDKRQSKVVNLLDVDHESAWDPRWQEALDAAGDLMGSKPLDSDIWQVSLAASLVGATITAAATLNAIPGKEWGDQGLLRLRLDDGRVIEITSWGYDASGLEIYEPEKLR